MDMDPIAQAAGFTNAEEMNKMVAEVDLTTSEGFEAFETWKEEDGTKAGLITLLEAQQEE
jgi:hypothetical protein